MYVFTSDAIQYSQKLSAAHTCQGFRRSKKQNENPSMAADHGRLPCSFTLRSSWKGRNFQCRAWSFTIVTSWPEMRFQMTATQNDFIPNHEHKINIKLVAVALFFFFFFEGSFDTLEVWHLGVANHFKIK